MLSPKAATRLAIVIGAGIVAFATLAFARGHWGTVYDDALIYLRYVKNLHAGCGPTFTCGQPPVEGFTSPLYLAVLWLATSITNQPIWWTQVISIGSLVIAGALAVATASVLARDEQRAWLAPVAALATALALALDPYFLLNANIGMETALAAAVFAFAALAAALARPWLLVAAALLCVLARPEGMLCVAALPLLPPLRRVRYLAVAIGAVLAITLVRYAIFGDLLPNTYYAKSGGTWRHAALGARYIADCALDFPLCFAAVLAWRTRYLPAIALAWLAFFLRSGGDTFEYSRLWVPLVPALTALALAQVARRVRGRWALAAAPLLALVAGVRAAVVHHIPDQGASPRLVEWMLAGTYLREHYPPGTLVATVPIGAIGYYSQLPILDLVGLTDRTIAHAGHSVPAELLTKQWIGHERHDTPYVLGRAPRVIVTTMQRATPWTLVDAKAGFWADWLILEAIKMGRAPYHVLDVELRPGDHLLMFERDH
jgi:arabinofuranosyltransferase